MTQLIQRPLREMRGDIHREAEALHQHADELSNVWRGDLKQLHAELRQEIHATRDAYEAGALGFGTLGLVVGLVIGLFVSRG